MDRNKRRLAILVAGALAVGLALGPATVQAYDLPKPGSTTIDGRVADLEQAVNDLHRRLCGHYPADTECTPPDTTISAGPTSPTTSTSASLTFTASKTGSRFSCALDAGTYAACTSPQAYSGLTEGAHTFTVRATDTYGNTDVSPATRSWTVSPPPPPAVKPRMGGTVAANTDWAGWESAMGASSYRRTYDGALPASFAASKAGTAGDYAAGRESVWSYKPTITSTGLSQASQDALLAFLRTVPVGHRFTLIVYHEPEDNFNATFTLAGWKEAQRQAGTLVDQVNTEKGASSKLRLGISLMGPWTFDSRSAYSSFDWTFTPAQLAAIDVVGIDPYFWNPGDPSMQQMLTHDDSGTGTGTSRSTMAHLDAWGKPVLFTEWGTTRTGRSDTQRATDITGTYNWAKARNADTDPATQQIEGMIYFHLDPGTDSRMRDLWKVIGYPAAETALRDAMTDSRTP
jgi:hypothetical protein